MVKDLSEQDLLLAISQGDEQAFAVLYNRYHVKLSQFLTKFTATDPSKGADILQEAFLRLWLNRDRIPEINNFQSWIYKVVSNEGLTFLRKEVHSHNKTLRLKELYDSDQMESVHIPRLMEFDELKNVIQQSINKMPDQRRKIYLLSREQGLTSAEIAAHLNISPNTVYNTLTTALKQIRQDLSDNGYLVSITIMLLLKII
jgi:RNA polymerase sigma-70 factor (family 1)